MTGSLHGAAGLYVSTVASSTVIICSIISLAIRPIIQDNPVIPWIWGWIGDRCSYWVIRHRPREPFGIKAGFEAVVHRKRCSFPTWQHTACAPTSTRRADGDWSKLAEHHERPLLKMEWTPMEINPEVRSMAWTPVLWFHRPKTDWLTSVSFQMLNKVGNKRQTLSNGVVLLANR